MAHYCSSCAATLTAAGEACGDCGTEPPPQGFPEDARLGTAVAGGQYEVLRRIGEGGFGVVYEVQTAAGGLRRALKVLNAQWARDDDIRARFLGEAEMLERVNHPSLGRCYAAGYMDGASEPYLLLELIVGKPLGTVLEEAIAREQAAGMAPMRAVRLAKQIASGLAVAHDAGVLHRDLKPDNILVIDPGGLDERIKVVDFGIAKFLDAGSASTQTVVGTPAYMAPEQFMPGTALDARVDLWQLGALLHKLLTGEPPYRPKTGGIAAIVGQQQARADLGPAPSETVEALSKHRYLDLLVARLLATDPSRRPKSASEVCDELARIENDLDPSAVRDNARTLLGALCATPSESAWVALQRYLLNQGADTERLVGLANELLTTWPDELRVATLEQWEASRGGTPHSVWKQVRALDLAGHCLTDDDVVSLANNPALAVLTRLNLSRNEIGNEGVAALAASPHLSALSSLDLSGNRITSVGLDALSQSEALPALRSLKLAHNGIGSRGVTSLASGKLCLRALDLTGNELDTSSATALAEGASLGALERLRLGTNALGSDGVAALAVSKHLARLELLDLTHNGVGASGAAALALSDNVRHLHSLLLGQNGLGREGLQLLLGSPAFESLEEFDLSGNQLGASGAMLLAGSPFVRRLRRLELADNELGDAGTAALLGSSHLAGLRHLVLSRNEIGAAGANLISGAPPQLESLDLAGNPLGEAGAVALAAALAHLRITHLSVDNATLNGGDLARIASAGRLTRLSASRNDLGGDHAFELAASTGLEGIAELNLGFCKLGAGGVKALCSAGVLGRLTSLDLSSNELGDAGIAALVAGAPMLPGIEQLNLDDNALGPDAASLIAAAPVARHLQDLSLNHNDVGDRGVEALARSAGWHALRRLSLQGNRISRAGAATLTTSSCLGNVQHLDLAHNAVAGEVDIFSLDTDKVRVMEDTFARITAMGADFAESFYDELFTRYPAVKPLFARTTMAKQKRHLMGSLVLVVDHMRDPETVERALRELGQRHHGYDVAPTHYYAVTSTLLDTLRAALGDEWNDAVHDAWESGLEAVAQVMMGADRRGPTTRVS